MTLSIHFISIMAVTNIHLLATQTRFPKTVMTNHLWLVWYRAQTPMGPKHWSLFVTYDTDEQALGTIYHVRLFPSSPSPFYSKSFFIQVEGNGWGTGQFSFMLHRGAQLKGARGSQAYEGRLYLGEIWDGVNGMMHEYCGAATEMINEHNDAHVVGESNCQDWCLLVIKSLEDGKFIPCGTKVRAKACPRR